MANPTLKTTVKLEGEKEYKEALKNINATMKELKSEIRLVDAEYGENKNSIEALTKKGEIYQKLIDEQKKKVEQLTNELEKNKQAFKEGSTQVTNAQTALNNARASLAELENEARANTEAMKGNTNSVADLAEKLGINLPEGAEKALSGIGNFSTGAVAAFAAAAAAVKILIDASKKLIDITQEAARYVDDLNTLSTKSGIDTYTLQVLNYMEDLADVDVSDIVSSMTKLEQSMEKAANGTAEQQAAFELLGVSVVNADGSMRDATDTFWDAIDALGQVQNTTERDQLAMDLFGRSAKELNTLIAIGSEGFNGYAKEAESVGYILDSKANKALNSYNDSLDRANKQMEAIRNQMAAQMAPSLETLNEGWTKLKTEGLQAIADSGVIKALGELLELLGLVAEGVGYLIEGLNALLHPIETLEKLLGKDNEEMATTAAVTEAATVANEGFKTSVSGDAAVLNNTANAANNAANKLREYALAAGYAQISDARLAELGSYSQSNAEHGAGFLGDYAGYTRDEFKSLLAQNGITSASQISSVLGEDAYRYYLSSAYYNAAGDYNFVGGRTIVGENGPEMVTLPRGSQIATAQETREAGGDVYNITIDAKSVQEFNDIVRLVKYSRVTRRMQ